MNERDTHRSGPPREPRGAILDPAAAAAAFRIARLAPAPELAPFVRHYWFLRWDLDGRPPHTQSTLTLPAANAVVQVGEDTAGGASTRRFDRVLTGSGAVFGALFRPAGFQPFWRRSMHLLTDRSLPFVTVFGVDAAPIRAVAFPDPGDDGPVVAAFDAFLLGCAPILDPEGAAVGEWVDAVEQDPTIGRAERLAERVGVGLRTLQRAMRRHVGLGPKQVIRRYRLLEASARLARGEDVDQTHLAFDLGYADQAHFSRDFARVIGRAPGRYAADQTRIGPRSKR